MYNRTGSASPETNESKEQVRTKKWSRRSLLASLGLTGAALVCAAAFRHSVGSAGASVTESAYTPVPTPQETSVYPQVDYVRLLREHNETATTLYAKVTGDRMLEVAVPFKGKRCAHYAFAKDPNDDFIKLMQGSVSVVDTVYTRTGSLDYASKSGVWVTGFPPNEYTTQVGATFSFTFDGTGFDFQHYTDNRGGVWEFNVDGTLAVAVSTHIDAVPAGQVTSGVARQPIARGLAGGTHTVIATFKGDDPEHAPAGGAGTARGWVRNAAA